MRVRVSVHVCVFAFVNTRSRVSHAVRVSVCVHARAFVSGWLTG